MEKAVCFGLQWGDEGKGKVTTYLSKDFDYVVRYSGGSNAGHTVEYENFKVVHHLIPSFNVFSECKGYIANNVVLDMKVIVDEIESLKKLGFDISNRIKISSHSNVVLPIHKLLDEKFETIRGSKAIGTTKRGIGPAYADKVHRINLRLKDLEDKESALEKMKYISHIYESLYGIKWDDYSEIFELYDKIKEFVVSPLEFKSTLESSSILFEGTQGFLLDVDMGTYPYVTGTNCSVTGIETGIGYPVNLQRRIGVFKAYVTRVGEGPFTTELFGDEGENLRQAGKEYGATTGRPRRCGWLDLPLLKYAIEITACNEMIMTKADVLSGMKVVKVCTKYIDTTTEQNVDMPVDVSELERYKPVYEEFEGWKDLEDENFMKFKEFVEKQTGVKITYISTGAKIDQIIKL